MRTVLAAVILGATCLSAGLLAGCAPRWQARAEDERAEPSGFIIQSHRGAGELAPENTLESFELAWSIGTVPEADVRATHDGVPVAFHDATLDRLVKDLPAELRGKGVADLTWAEASRLDVGAYKGERFAGQRIPRIRDVFERMTGRPQRWLYLDVKRVPLEELVRLAREYGVERQLILASTDYTIIRRWHEIAPQARTLHWMGGSEKKLAERLAALRAADFEGVSQLQIHVRVQPAAAADAFEPSSEFLRGVGRELRQRGILFQTFVVNSGEPEVYRKLIALGVQSFATDHPEAVLKVVQEKR